MPDILPLITARGGSKGIPRKNLTPLAGKPLLAWTIEAALHSRLFDQVYVSTDDEEIARVARAWNASVPFLRPAALAQDDSSHISVVCHALEWFASQRDWKPSYLLLLQPTSPFRTAQDIRAAVGLLETTNAESIVSVCPVNQHPYLTVQIESDGTLKHVFPSDLAYKRRQALPAIYTFNGAIYITRREILLEQRTFFPARTVPYVMPPERSLEIDEPWDLHVAGLVMQDCVHASRAPLTPWDRKKTA